MALARFFEKAALSAGEVLRKRSYSEIKSRLEDQRVLILLGDDHQTHEATVLSELLVNLLARLYPRLDVRCTGADPSGRRDALLALARRINPIIDVCGGDPTVIVGVGDVRDAAHIRAASSGWLARVSTEAPLKPCADTENPFGAAAAACLAASMVFRRVFADMLAEQAHDRGLGGDLEWDVAAGRSLSATADIGQVVLVGAGAIGCGAVWVLEKASGLQGTLDVVDCETIQLGNLQRYVLAMDGDERASKALLATSHLSRLRGTAEARSFRDFATNRGHDLGLVAAAVDSEAARLEIQGALPRAIVNAWTRPEDLGVSRHLSFGETACLACLYAPQVGGKSESALVAEATGLDEMEVRAMLSLGTTLESQHLERISLTSNVDLDALLPFLGRTLRAFYGEAVCGGVLFRAGQEATRDVAPLAHQSALAGVLLAVEIVAAASGVGCDFPTSTKFNVLNPLLPAYHDVTAKRTSCICEDGDFRAVYTEKHVPRT